jgi:NADH:ubiquinone oxidoreductase subunit 2 (subunit N)
MIGFLAKAGIFISGWYLLYLVALISIVFSVVSTFIYIRVIKVLYFENLLVGKLYPYRHKKTRCLKCFNFFTYLLFIYPCLYLYQLQNDFVVALIRLHSSGL